MEHQLCHQRLCRAQRSCRGRIHRWPREFFDSELFHGRNILVRFSIWPVSPTEVRSEQAFSADGGATWETNWINTYTRVSDKSGS